MPQIPAQAVIYLTGDKASHITTSVADGERVAAHLSGGIEHTVEVTRQPDGARVVIRAAAIASVAFEPERNVRPAPRSYSGGGHVNG